MSQDSVATERHLSVRKALVFGWSYWSRFPAACAIALFLSISTPIIGDIFGSYVYGRLTDAIATQVQGERSLRPVFLPLLLLTFVWCYYWYGVHIRHFIRNYIDHRNLRKFFCDLSAHVQRLDVEWHNSTLSGSTVRAVNRGMWGLNELGDLIFNGFLPTIAVTLGGLTMLFFMQPLFGCIMLGFALPYTALTLLSTTRYAAPKQLEAVYKESRGNGALADVIGGNFVVKSFAAEDRESTRLRDLMHNWSVVVKEAWDRDNKIGVWQVTLMISFRVVFASISLLQWQKGALSVGDFVFLMSIQYDVFAYLRDIGMHIRNLQKSVSDLDEAVFLFSLPTELPDNPNAKDLDLAKGEIEFRKVCFGYKGQNKQLYRNLNLKLAAGQSVALVGRSGSGKSTFLKLLQRLYELDEGTILIDNQDISTVTRASLRRGIALVPQDPVLFHRSIADNIAYARPDAPAEDIQKAAILAHADEFIARLPQGYDTVVGERGVKLSGGERQRVAIARAILANSPILILDEATSSLDTESEQHIQKAFAWLMKNRTTIIIAHRLSTIREADRVLVFEQGRIVEDGTHNSLLTNANGLYRRMYQMQSGGFLHEQPGDATT